MYQNFEDFKFDYNEYDDEKYISNSRCCWKDIPTLDTFVLNKPFKNKHPFDDNCLDVLFKKHKKIKHKRKKNVEYL